MGWVTPVIMGISALASWLQNKKAADAQKQRYAQAQTGRGVSYDPTNPLSHFLQDLYGMKDSNPVTTMTGESNTESDQAPYITPGYSGIADMLKSHIQARLSRPTGMEPGYEAAGVRSINDTFGGVNKALANRLASMGQGGAPSGAAAFATTEAGRGRQLADFRASLPELARARETQDIGLGQALTEAFGKGMHTSSRTRSNQSSTTTGGVTPAMQLLAQIFGQDRAAALGTNPSDISVAGNTGMSMAQMLMMLYGSGAFDKKGATT